MNSVLIDLGFIEIKWYSFLILMGIIIGGMLAIREAKKFNISPDFMFNLLFWSIIMGFVGARLYYVVFNWDVYRGDISEIFKIWNGGLAIHGGIIFGGLTAIIYARKYKASVFKILDIMTVPLLLAQAIGRWGNFFNQEAHGAATNLEHLQSLHIPNFIIEGMEINGIYYQPTFLYESLWCILGFIILLIVRRHKYLKVGQLTCLYFMWYGVGRFFIESMRTDSLMFGGFKAAQIFSVVAFVIALLVFMVLSRKGKFEDLYNEENAEVRF